MSRSTLLTRAGNALDLARKSLAEAARGLASRIRDPVRLARISCLTNLDLGFSAAIAGLQRPDGGWSDVEESVWCTRLLAFGGKEYRLHVERAVAWIKSMQHHDGGWGLSDRDTSKIPITGLVVTLLPAIANGEALKWLVTEWERDLSSTVRLTYKGGFTLMALAQHQNLVQAENLVSKTIDYLRAEQSEDGGFGPWKNHPVGSDPWSTGIVLVGLTSWQEEADPHVIERAVEWLCNTQLISGLWPYHFIDEGSSYAYWGLAKSIEYFEIAGGRKS